MSDLFDAMPEDVYDDEGNIIMKVCSCCDTFVGLGY